MVYWAYVYMPLLCVCVCRSGVSFSDTSYCFLRQGVTGLKLVMWIRLAGQQASGIYLALFSHYWDCKLVPLCLAFIYTNLRIELGFLCLQGCFLPTPHLFKKLNVLTHYFDNGHILFPPFFVCFGSWDRVSLCGFWSLSWNLFCRSG